MIWTSRCMSTFPVAASRFGLCTSVALMAVSWLGLSKTSTGLRAGAVARSGVGRAEVGEVGQEVGVGVEALRRDLAVGQPGEAVAVDVFDGPAAVGVKGGLGAVVAQGVG